MEFGYNENLVQDIQNSFLRLLSDYLPKDLLEKARSNKKIKILSICCGRFREAKSIFDYFLGHEEFIRLYGIDLSEELLELAKSDSFIKVRGNSIYLKKGDASKIESYQDWLKDGLFDLVIIRHPEITFNTDTFIKTFSLCDDLLTRNSYLIATTHFENEKESLKLLLKLLKFNILVEVENKLAPSVKKEGEKPSFADRFLIVVSL